MTEPYYQDDLVTLYHGDCREIREWLSADVLVTDPPYGMAYSSSFARAGRGKYRRPTDRRPIAGDASVDVRDLALLLWGAERPALVFGRWDAPRPRGVRKRLIWDKGDSPGMGDLRLPWGQSDEEIYLLGDWPARDGGPKRTGSLVRAAGYMSGARARPAHPTPKPVELLVQLIERCPPGVLADPFAGSGPVALAAHQLGRRAVLVELEERYCEVVATRLSEDRGAEPAGVGTVEADRVGGPALPFDIGIDRNSVVVAQAPAIVDDLDGGTAVRDAGGTRVVASSHAPTVDHGLQSMQGVEGVDEAEVDAFLGLLGKGGGAA